MQFRPCIDIHNGKVKQIVGSTLSDLGKTNGHPKENFVADKDATYYAKIYKRDGLRGGHIINLNMKGTDEYETSKEMALKALSAYPGGMQYGGGVDDKNARDFISAGASHVIVTSFVFNNGRVDYDALKRLSETVGREHLVLDLSCTRVDDKFVIVTDRWQNISKEVITYNFLDRLAFYCDEFLIHAADVEGRGSGIDRDLVGFLSRYKRVPITYAGGVHDYGDIELISYLSDNNMDFTVGSCLDLFGGELSYDRIVKRIVNR
ncbi:1-(5-phosphoribosyl)-5-[(5-phosphoribosylamino)methylideneamino] imidazole-4-carboxamide isomerase [Pseudobutyrivibrio sp. YE44]|uniref:phosphoribosylformimino-5-aminoimidazole carboxamide ribotide isomerase n=1 Tax=Pseudobutyrivibrio sp. YE44 TaxID=1520802 RepID=UPI0008884440|nr:phosphoribosylformimino-5-aminoimidazole carboxamide ribotide isomerase [Pseudobutyrivibrio sp. YE44]SDB25770.1 1-(5-phosphoribosyl)-5-[(5-phosphoribosylamino)methylideneamino] imidazole-4-carboxamide isomerase [Pseudobutyrivibrio sp. YE44]